MAEGFGYAILGFPPMTAVLQGYVAHLLRRP